MTEPDLSSLAGRNPNPVLAVTSGKPEMELEPLNLSLIRDLLRVLFVISGIVFTLFMSFFLLFTFEVIKFIDTGALKKFYQLYVK